MKPVPGAGVVKRAPRMFRKPSNGVPETVVKQSPPPSQLISRRPLKWARRIAIVGVSQRSPETIYSSLN